MKRTVLGALVVPVMVIFGLISCGDETPTSIKMVACDTLFVDSTMTLDIAMEPVDFKGSVNWTSSNPDVASIDAQGLITGLKAGTSIITANVGDKVAATQLVVLNNPVELTISVAAIEQKKCTLDVKASYEGGCYYCGYIEKDSMANRTEEQLKNSVVYSIAMTIMQYAMMGQQISLQQLLPTGSGKLIASGLKANTEYMFFAFGIDAITGRVSPKMATVVATTPDVVPSDITITMAFDSIATTTTSGKVNRKVYFKAIPSNQDPFVFNGAVKHDLDSIYGGNDTTFFQNFEAYYDRNYSSMGGCDYVAKSGERDIYFSNPNDGDTLVTLAAGYKGGFTSQVFHYEYIYKLSDEPSAPARLVPVRSGKPAEEVVNLPFLPMLKNSCYKIQ